MTDLPCDCEPEYQPEQSPVIMEHGGKRVVYYPDGSIEINGKPLISDSLEIQSGPDSHWAVAKMRSDLAAYNAKIAAGRQAMAAASLPPDIQFVYGIPVTPIGPVEEPAKPVKSVKRMDEMRYADYVRCHDAYWPHRRRA